MDIIIFIACLILYFSDRRPYAWLGFFVLITNYFGYGTNTSFFIVKHNVSDIGLLFAIIVVTFDHASNAAVRYRKYLNAIWVLFTYIVITAFVDRFSNGTSFMDIVKTCKGWLVLLSFLPMSTLTRRELKQLITGIVIVTIIQCLIYYIQYFTGIRLIEYQQITYYYAGQSVERGAFPPTFAFFVFVLLIGTYNRGEIFKLKFRVLILLLIFGIVILSTTRSILLAFVIGGSLSIVINNFTPQVLLSLFIFLCITVTIVAQNGMLSTRLNEGLVDIKFAFAESYKNADANETFSFRIFHFRERLDYVRQSATKLMIGMGYIHESSLRKEIFSIGEDAEDGNGIVQIDTGDIAWSILIIRFGLIGIAIYLYFYFIFLGYFFRNRNSEIAKVAFIFLTIHLLLFSFVGNNIAIPYFWPFIFVLFFFQNKTHQPKESNESTSISNNSDTFIQPG